MDATTNHPGTYQPHPLAELFPLIDGEAFAALVEDIRAHGVREPVVMLDGMILDGRNRWRAANQYEPSIPVPTVEYEGDDPLAFVISQNIHRRHLTESQRAMVATKIANLDQGQRQTGKFAGVPTQAQAAEMLNVSERTVRSAAAVQDHATPELVAEVEAGNVSISAAAEVATLPKPEQAKVVAGGKKAVVAKAKEMRAAKAKQPSPAPTPRVLDPDQDRPAQTKARQVVQAKLDSDLPIVTKEIAAEVGVSVDSVERAIAQERAVREVEAEWRENPPIDPATLSLSAQRKLEIAERRLEKHNERVLRAWGAQFEQRIHERVLAETADRLAMLERQQAEALAQRDRYDKLTNNFRPIFTVDEWETLRRVAHPDNSASEALRSRAFSLINAKKLQLTGAK